MAIARREDMLHLIVSPELKGKLPKFGDVKYISSEAEVPAGKPVVVLGDWKGLLKFSAIPEYDHHLREQVCELREALKYQGFEVQRLH